LSRLTDIEKRIQALDETLKRMATILASVTDLKAEVKAAKTEILAGIGSTRRSQDDPHATEEVVSLMVSELQATKDQLLTTMNDVISALTAAKGQSDVGTQGDVGRVIDGRMKEFGDMMRESLEGFKLELFETIGAIRAAAPPAAATSASVPAYSEEPPEETPTVARAAAAPVASSLSADRGMKVADQLERIVDSMKMGCLAGDVLDVMNEAKDEIMKIVPSDAIMVKIDKWAGLVGSYSKRHQLQAKDILKLKKEIKDEIPKYRPA